MLIYLSFYLLQPFKQPLLIIFDKSVPASCVPERTQELLLGRCSPHLGTRVRARGLQLDCKGVSLIESENVRYTGP